MNNNEIFAYVTNAEEDSWSYGIKNLSDSLLYKLAIDYWKPNMFSSCDGDKFIELPFACLDICADALTIPKKFLIAQFNRLIARFIVLREMLLIVFHMLLWMREIAK